MVAGVDLKTHKMMMSYKETYKINNNTNKLEHNEIGIIK
jgi:hypothetical protein